MAECGKRVRTRLSHINTYKLEYRLRHKNRKDRNQQSPDYTYCAYDSGA
jgi:hypothetical protein